MAVEVNGVEDLTTRAISKACNDWRSDRSCTHPGCRQDQRGRQPGTSVFADVALTRYETAT
jgi:hypothetical protein